MITETGHVVGFESGDLLVETRGRSACGTCVASKGCGQKLLASEQLSVLRAQLSDEGLSQRYVLGDEVLLGIDENAFLVASILVYCVPLVCLVVSIVVGDHFSVSEGVSVVIALIGLEMGGVLSRHFSQYLSKNKKYQVSVIERLDRDSDSVTPIKTLI